MTWDKHTKPPADLCPEIYCFHWVPAGGAADLSGRTYSSFQEAVTRRADWIEFPQGGCGCGFGVCTRMDKVAGDHDWYESDNLALKQDGLPWFYFIPSTDNLRTEFHESYLRESQALWGTMPHCEPSKPASSDEVADPPPPTK
jgi:hypothetical protein